MTWLGGLFLFDEVDRQPTTIRLGGPRLVNFLLLEVEADSQAGFGQATVGVTRRVSVTGGLRYTRERKTIDNLGRLSTFDVPTLFLPGAYAYHLTHRVDAEGRIRDSCGETNVGLRVRCARIQERRLQPHVTGAGRGYAPEWAWSYEGGVKPQSPVGRARLSVAVFQTDYTNLQVQTSIRPGVIDISNAAAATIQGFEVEGSTELTRAVHVGGHRLAGCYLRYTAVGVGGVMGDVAGNRLNNAPQWSGRLWFEWSGNIGQGRGFGSPDSRVESPSSSRPSTISSNGCSYGLVDVSAEFGPSRRWAVGVYARNLTNADLHWYI